MLAAAGCNGPGRALGEDQRPADDLTDEALIERCATASPDEEGLGCPDGCVTVDLRDGTKKSGSICGGGGYDDVVLVCAPTRGTAVVQGVEIMHPDHPSRVAFTHGCMDSSLTWLPIGWERCVGEATEPSQCQCSLDDSGDLIAQSIFWSLVECAAVSQQCEPGGNRYDVPPEDEICIWSGLRDRVPGVYSFLYRSPSGVYSEGFWLVPGDEEGTFVRFINKGPPLLGGNYEQTPSDACDAAGHDGSSIITRCELGSPELFQTCIDNGSCAGLMTADNCLPVFDPFPLCEALRNRSASGP